MNLEHYLTPEYLDSIYGATVIADSIASNGARLTTTVLRMWRPVLAEHNTHRTASRSVASSRALPAWKLIERVLLQPAVPVRWWKEHTGMQGNVELTGKDRLDALNGHLFDRDTAIIAVMRDVEIDIEKIDARVREAAYFLQRIARADRQRHYDREDAPGLSKQIVNRKLEPWMVVEVINSSTDLNNVFALRDHPAAESNFQFVAHKWRLAREASTPVVVPEGGWHLPFIREEDREWAARLADGIELFPKSCPSCRSTPPPGSGTAALLANGDCYVCGHSFDPLGAARAKAFEPLKKLSAARCARVSYLNHLGVCDPQDDIRLHDQLISQSPPHAAAFEHCARALAADDLEEWCMTHHQQCRASDGCRIVMLPRRVGNFRGWHQYRFDVPNHVKEG